MYAICDLSKRIGLLKLQQWVCSLFLSHKSLAPMIYNRCNFDILKSWVLFILFRIAFIRAWRKYEVKLQQSYRDRPENVLKPSVVQGQGQPVSS